MLSLKQVNEICLHGKGAKECRYLLEDIYKNKFYCGKCIQSKKPLVDAEVQEYLRQARARGIDPYVMTTPIGNNCQGYLFLKHKVQGIT